MNAKYDKEKDRRNEKRIKIFYATYTSKTGTEYGNDYLAKRSVQIIRYVKKNNLKW